MRSSSERDILSRVDQVLLSESGKPSINPEWTLGELFAGNRFKYATAMARLEQMFGQLCETDVYEKLLGKSIEFLRWTIHRNIIPEITQHQIA